MIEESKKNKSDTTLNDRKIKYKFKRYVKDSIISCNGLFGLFNLKPNSYTVKRCPGYVIALSLTET